MVVVRPRLTNEKSHFDRVMLHGNGTWYEIITEKLIENGTIKLMSFHFETKSEHTQLRAN